MYIYVYYPTGEITLEFFFISFFLSFLMTLIASNYYKQYLMTFPEA